MLDSKRYCFSWSFPVANEGRHARQIETSDNLAFGGYVIYVLCLGSSRETHELLAKQFDFYVVRHHKGVGHLSQDVRDVSSKIVRGGMQCLQLQKQRQRATIVTIESPCGGRCQTSYGCG